MSAGEDLLGSLDFYGLFLRGEKVRWNISDIDWQKIDRSLIQNVDLQTARRLAWVELTTFSATRDFLVKYGDDLDFSQWLSMWFYEETRHPFVLMKYLEQYGEKFSAEFMTSGREIHPMRDDKVETLVLNIISEITAFQGYHLLAQLTAEPVLKNIYSLLAADEFRHAMGFQIFAKKALAARPDREKAVFNLLRLIRFSVYSRAQKHPVREGINSILTPEFVEAHGGMQVFAEMEIELEARLMKQFSTLLSMELRNRNDVDAAILDFGRASVGALSR